MRPKLVGRSYVMRWLCILACTNDMDESGDAPIRIPLPYIRLEFHYLVDVPTGGLASKVICEDANAVPLHGRLVSVVFFEQTGVGEEVPIPAIVKGLHPCTSGADARD